MSIPQSITKELNRFITAEIEKPLVEDRDVIRLLDAYREAFSVDLVYITVIDPDNYGFTFTHCSAADEKMDFTGNSVIYGEGEYESENAIYDQNDVVDWSSVSGRNGIQSILHAAVRHQGIVDGCVGFADYHNYREWSEDEREALRMLYRLLSGFITERRLRNLLKLQNERLEKEKEYVLELTHADIELEHKQDKLNRAVSRIRRAEHSKGLFLNNMSHDIRTPMNAIIGFTDIAAKNIDKTETLKDCFNKIRQSGEYLISILNDVLDVSSIEDDDITITKKPVSLKKQIESVMTMVQGSASEKAIKLRNPVLKKITHDIVFTDALRFNRIMLNLLNNAIKYTPDGGEVAMSVEELPLAENGLVPFRFEIRDNGIGMDSEFLARAFEPFARAQSTGGTIQGTGLGLYITKELVTALGGTISLESKPGKGTVASVQFNFAVNEAALEDDDPFADEAERGAGEKTPLTPEEVLKGKKVLIVEDNEFNREIADEVLTDAGIITFMAEDGDVAVNMMRNAVPGDYDFILMDIQMPHMNGYDAARTIRALPDREVAGIPIIALTANAFEQDRRKALASGMNEHLTKPIKIPELMKTLADILSRR